MRKNINAELIFGLCNTLVMVGGFVLQVVGPKVEAKQNQRFIKQVARETAKEVTRIKEESAK